jgi:lipopolysaccharide transport system permease protein
MLTGVRKFLVLVAFKALAELRSERQRTYLGFLWWIFEPTFFMLVFYVVFGVLLSRGGPDFVASLLCGLVLWQWFNSAIMHSTTSIQAALPLVRSVRVPTLMFPFATVVADSVKFVFVFVILVGLLALLGHFPGSAWIALPLVLLAEFVLICGCCFVVAALVPFVPDLRFVISPLLQGMFFLSAIFFTLDSLTPRMRWWVELNPMAVLIDGGRGILLYDHLPGLGGMLAMLAIGCAVAIVGAALVCGLSYRYPKLAD